MLSGRSSCGVTIIEWVSSTASDNGKIARFIFTCIDINERIDKGDPDAETFDWTTLSTFYVGRRWSIRPVGGGRDRVVDQAPNFLGGGEISWKYAE
jgi:hypothetical protein